MNSAASFLIACGCVGANGACVVVDKDKKQGETGAAGSPSGPARAGGGRGRRRLSPACARADARPSPRPWERRWWRGSR